MIARYENDKMTFAANEITGDAEIPRFKWLGAPAHKIVDEVQTALECGWTEVPIEDRKVVAKAWRERKGDLEIRAPELGARNLSGRICSIRGYSCVIDARAFDRNSAQWMDDAADGFPKAAQSLASIIRVESEPNTLARKMSAKRGPYKNWRTYEEAKKYIHKLGLRNSSDWKLYLELGERPDDIPCNPWEFYEEWTDWADWLGDSYCGAKRRWRPFLEARKHARSTGLEHSSEWNEYSKSGKCPFDIPSNPRVTFKNMWKGWGDWLGVSQRKKSLNKEKKIMRLIDITSYGKVPKNKDLIEIGRTLTETLRVA